MLFGWVTYSALRGTTRMPIYMAIHSEDELFGRSGLLTNLHEATYVYMYPVILTAANASS